VTYNAISADLGSPYVRRNPPRMYGMEMIYKWCCGVRQTGPVRVLVRRLA